MKLAGIITLFAMTALSNPIICTNLAQLECEDGQIITYHKDVLTITESAIGKTTEYLHTPSCSVSCGGPVCAVALMPQKIEGLHTQKNEMTESLHTRKGEIVFMRDDETKSNYYFSEGFQSVVKFDKCDIFDFN